MKKKIILIFVLILIIIILLSNFWYSNNNLVFISEENKKELMNVLEIEDAPSFKLISKNNHYLGFGSTPNCYKLKFEISIEDYDKNNLKYEDVDNENDIPLIDIHYKLQKDEDTYICIVKTSDQNEHTKILYNKILDALK